MNVITIDKVHDLVDFVIWEGSYARQIFIDYICRRDSIHVYELGFSSGKISAVAMAGREHCYFEFNVKYTRVYNI